jgi:hypothetical protein
MWVVEAWRAYSAAMSQGLTLVHIRAQRKRFCGIWGAFRGCLGGVQVVSGGIRGYLESILCQKRLRLS